MRSVAEMLEEAAVLADEYLRVCDRCHLCSSVCASYRALGDPMFSPAERLRRAARIILGGPVERGDVESLYTCSLCGACTAVCPYGIEVWRLVHAARARLSVEGRQPASLQAVVYNVEKGGHSFTPDPSGPAKLLAAKAREHGVAVDEPAQALYVPSPFDTTLYPSVLDASLALLRAAGVEATVSTRVLDFGGNAGIDASRLDVGFAAFQRALEEAERLGASAIILSGCGADQKLARVLEAMGYRGRVRILSLYEAVYQRLDGAAADDALLFPSCGFARFERREYRAVRSALRGAREPRDKPPFTLCCGGGGGVNYLREKPLAELKNRIYRWRIARLASQSPGRLTTPCIKCYTVFRHAALLAGLAKRLRIEHSSTLLASRLLPHRGGSGEEGTR